MRVGEDDVVVAVELSGTPVAERAEEPDVFHLGHVPAVDRRSEAQRARWRLWNWPRGDQNPRLVRAAGMPERETRVEDGHPGDDRTGLTDERVAHEVADPAQVEIDTEDRAVVS